MTRYTCGFFPHILAIIPATWYTCVFCHVYFRFIPKYMTIFLQTPIYMRTKKPIYMRYKQACGICGRRKSSYKRHWIIPSAKTPSCTMELKSNLVWIKHGCNARVNFEQDFVLIHCPHSSCGCWLPDNGFVGIRGLSVERLCTLFHKCWPK